MTSEHVFSATCSLGKKWPWARIARRQRAFSDAIALVEQLTLRISTSKSADVTQRVAPSWMIRVCTIAWGNATLTGLHHMVHRV